MGDLDFSVGFFKKEYPPSCLIWFQQLSAPIILNSLWYFEVEDIDFLLQMLRKGGEMVEQQENQTVSLKADCGTAIISATKKM